MPLLDSDREMTVISGEIDADMQQSFPTGSESGFCSSLVLLQTTRAPDRIFFKTLK